MDISREFYYRIKSNEKLEGLCEEFNTSLENIVRNNRNIPLYAGEWIKVKVNDYITYRVKPMDTLESVSCQFGVTKEEIYRYNEIYQGKLYIGQILKIYKK